MPIARLLITLPLCLVLCSTNIHAATPPASSGNESADGKKGAEVHEDAQSAEATEQAPEPVDGSALPRAPAESEDGLGVDFSAMASEEVGSEETGKDVTIVEAGHSPPTHVRVEFRDGSVFQGRLLFSGPDGLTVANASTGTMLIPVHAVLSSRPVSEEEAASTAATAPAAAKPATPVSLPNGYLMGPSALPVGAMEWTLSQRGLLLTHLELGLTGWLSLNAGTVLPAWALWLPNWLVGARASARLSEYLHVAGSLYGMAVTVPRIYDSNASGRMLMGLGTMTAGSVEKNITFSVGLPLAFAETSAALDNSLWSISGSVRLVPRLALVAEQWTRLEHSDYPVPGYRQHTLSTLALRLLDRRVFGQAVSIDLGVFMGWGSYSADFIIPLPWINFHIHG